MTLAGRASKSEQCLNAHDLCGEWFEASDQTNGSRRFLIMSRAISANLQVQGELAHAVWSALQESRHEHLPDLLGLDYALAAIDDRSRTAFLSRGGIGRCGLFYRLQAGRLFLRSILPPVKSLQDIDHDGVMAFLSLAGCATPTDAVHTTRTVLKGWLRVPRSSVVCVDLTTGDERVSHFQISQDAPYSNLSDLDLAQAFREVVRSHVIQCAGDRRCAVETSGGIDSSIIASALHDSSPTDRHAGVSLLYPYYEFRHERRYTDAMFERLNWTPRYLDGSKTLAFDPFDARSLPRFGEPTRLASGFAQIAAVRRAAIDAGAQVLLNGHGGDQIFGMSPFAEHSLIKSNINLDLLRPAARREVRDHMEVMRKTHEEGDPRGHRHFFAGLMLYDRWMGEPPVGDGIICEPGLLSVDTLRLSWEVFSRPQWQENGIPGKRFARWAFADALPAEIRERRWKVGYDGLYRRGLFRNADRLIAMVNRQADHLETHGVDSRACIRSLERCREFHAEHTELLITVLSYCIWLDIACSGTGSPCQERFSVSS